MNQKKLKRLVISWLIYGTVSVSLFAGQPIVVDLWPGLAPGEKQSGTHEQDTTKEKDGLVAGKSVIRLGNVSKPTISVYVPDARKNTGTAVLVCPGGGYHILAMDLEGTEVCEWLNSIGVTAVLLKYRVPKREEQAAHVGPLQDAQRALGIVRSRSKEWGVNPNKIGVLGFSAGGHLAAALSANNKERSYSRVDVADDAGCRPDFSVLIYPAYLAVKDSDKIAPEVEVTTNTPPTFMVMAEDDPVKVENVLYYALALKRAKVPVELHVYPKGGHGYGLRAQKEFSVTTWPARVQEWMQSSGWLRP
jgi:acetyl esterase/lipase